MGGWEIEMVGRITGGVGGEEGLESSGNMVAGEKEVECSAGGSTITVDVANVVRAQRAKVTWERVGRRGVGRGGCGGNT